MLHAPVEIAGQMVLSALGQRELGVHATSLARPHQFLYEPRADIEPRNRIDFLWAAAKALRAHDLVHFYFGQSFLPDHRDAPWIARFGKQIVVEFLGSDVRMPSVEAARNPYYVRVDIEDDERATHTMRSWSKITGGHAVVGDHTLDTFLEPHFPHIHVVGQRVDTQRLQAVPPDPLSRRMRVIHSPTDRAAKGTEFIRRATSELVAAGAPIDYIEVHGLGHGEALAIYATADLVIDQLCAGGHGVFAVEAMSLAKPVVCYLLPEYQSKYPADLPIINANPDTIQAVLAEWLDRPRERHELGLASRAYAERNHDFRVVARRLLDVYETLPHA